MKISCMLSWMMKRGTDKISYRKNNKLESSLTCSLPNSGVPKLFNFQVLLELYSSYLICVLYIDIL